MPRFFNELDPFLGTGEKNAQQQDLETFLDAYDDSMYPHPSVTADMLVIQHPKKFQTVNDGLKILLIKRGNHPSIGYWGCPGGFADMKEDILDTARRELEEETGLKDIPMEQVHAFGEWKRDPRTRIVTVTFLALVEEGLHPQAGDDAAEAAFFDISFQSGNHRMEADRIYTNYDLTLSNAELGLVLTAKLQLTQNAGGILKQYQWDILESNGLSGDHGKLIGDTLFYLEHQLID